MKLNWRVSATTITAEKRTGTRVYDRMNRTRGLLVGLVFVLLACGVCGAQEQLYYHYFKEQRPLKLDTNRVAALQTRPGGERCAKSGFYEVRLGTEESVAVPVHGLVARNNACRQ